MNTLPGNNIFISLWRFIKLAYLLCSALMVMIFCYPFQTQAKRYSYLRVWSKRMMAIFKLQIDVTGDIPECFSGLLIMANHVSWLDIFALNYVHPVSFVAKKEIHGWPIIGSMVARAGTVFIDRNDRKDAVRIAQNIAVRMQEGGTVAVFPESTTTDGFTLLPLKAALFEAAIQANSLIQPVALLFYDENHVRTTLPSYVGETSLFTSLRIIMRTMRKGYIEVRFCPRIETGSGEDRFILCKKTQESLEEIIYQGLPPPQPEIEPS